MKKISKRKYFVDFLDIAPLSHALWRAVEALDFGRQKMKKPILDLGCGFGEFGGVVFNNIEIGIDININDLIKVTRGKTYKNLKWADANDLPFKDNYFNTIVSVSVLEHIPKLEKVIKEAHRVLKKDGKFIFSTPTVLMFDNLLIPKILKLLHLKKLANLYINYHNLAFKHISIKTPDWWKKRLEKDGFEIIEFKGTLSPAILKLHEVFLPLALPSQLWKLLFGKRLVIMKKIRKSLIPPLLSSFIVSDNDCFINIFVVARKK